MRRVLIVDDHGLVASALTGALRGRGYDARASPAHSDDGILAVVEQFAPEVVLLDLELGPHRTGLVLIPRLRAAGAGVVMLTGTRDNTRLAECLEAGAEGLLSKAAHIDDVVSTVERVAESGSAVPAAQRAELMETLGRHRRTALQALGPFHELTRREQQVLAALIDGKTAQVIADETFTSVRTVRGHIQAVLDKLGVSSQLAAVARAKEAGWQPPGPGV